MFYNKSVSRWNSVLNKEVSKKTKEKKYSAGTEKSDKITNPFSRANLPAKKPSVKPAAKPATPPAHISDPIITDTANIVARINNFNTNKTSNKMYGGYLNSAKIKKNINLM